MLDEIFAAHNCSLFSQDVCIKLQGRRFLSIFGRGTKAAIYTHLSDMFLSLQLSAQSI